MANDIMIDMETLDTSPYCVILTIGVVRFDPYGDGVVQKLELRSSLLLRQDCLPKPFSKIRKET